MQSAIGFNNYVLSAALAAGSAAPTMSVGNLQDETGSPSVAWQTAGGAVTSAAGANFTITPPLAAQTWRAAGIFRTNLTQSAMVTFSFVLNGTPVYSWASIGPTPGYGLVVHVAPDNIVADYCRIDIDDIDNPDGFINVPLCFAGPAWLPLSAPSYDTTIGSDSQSDETVSRGGQEFTSLLWFKRRMELAFAGIRPSELLSGVAPLERAARTGNNILFVPDIASDTLLAEAIYGRMTPTADIGYPYSAADRRSWRTKITERL